MKAYRFAAYMMLLASFATGMTACGDDEPEPDKPGAESPASAPTATATVTSLNLTSNGSVFTANERLELTIEELGVTVGGKTATLTDLTLSLEGTRLESFKTLPATLVVSDLSKYPEGKHVITATVTATADGKTATTESDIFTFHIAKESLTLAMSPKVLLFQSVSAQGQYDEKEDTPLLTIGQPYDWAIAMPATSAFTTKCAVTLMPYEDYLNIEANFDYKITEIKTYMVKDPAEGETIDLSKLTPQTQMDFDIAYGQPLPFSVLKVIYAIDYTREKDGQRYPDVHEIRSYDINLTQRSR